MVLLNKVKHWFEERKLAPVQYQPVTVYQVANAVIPPHRIVELMLYLNHSAPHHSNVTLPEYPCITERQYRALPSHLQSYFESRNFQPQWTS